MGICSHNYTQAASLSSLRSYGRSRVAVSTGEICVCGASYIYKLRHNYPRNAHVNKSYTILTLDRMKHPYLLKPHTSHYSLPKHPICTVRGYIPSKPLTKQWSTLPSDPQELVTRQSNAPIRDLRSTTKLQTKKHVVVRLRIRLIHNHRIK